MAFKGKSSRSCSQSSDRSIHSVPSPHTTWAYSRPQGQDCSERKDGRESGSSGTTAEEGEQGTTGQASEKPLEPRRDME